MKQLPGAGLTSEPVVLSLGSNVGDRAAYLSAATRYLQGGGALRVLARSSVYETEPVEGPVQGLFLNQVLLVRTDLPPALLLAHCKRVEDQLGRHRQVPHGPRTIDVDLLLYGDRVVNTPLLTLPHPALPRRKCILLPLLELRLNWTHPRLNADVAGLLSSCQDPSSVRLVLPELEE